MFCPAENNITRHNIKVCCIRFGFAIASLGMGAGNYLRDRKKQNYLQKVIKEQALAIVQHFMKEFLDPRWGGEMELMIESSPRSDFGSLQPFRRIQLLHFAPSGFTSIVSDSDNDLAY
jgi:hypothetical protein